MPLYEFEDNEGHIVEEIYKYDNRPDKVKTRCSVCKIDKIFKLKMSAGSFWGDFGTASSEAYKSRKKNTKSGIERDSKTGATKLNSAFGNTD